MKIDYIWLGPSGRQPTSCYITNGFIYAEEKWLVSYDHVYADRKRDKLITAPLMNHFAVSVNETVDNYIPPPAPVYYGHFQWMGGNTIWRFGFSFNGIISCAPNIDRPAVELRRDRWLGVMGVRRRSALYRPERFRTAMVRQGLKELV